MNWRPIHLSIIGTLVLTTVNVAWAAPPPVGPPAPQDPVKQLSVYGFLTPLLKTAVDETISRTNTTAAQDPNVHVRLSVSDMKVYTPRIIATSYLDRFNERLVVVNYMLSYRVHDIQKHTLGSWVGIPVERHISQDIDLQIFCDKWETGKGTLKLVVNAQAPYLEDEQGTLEEVVDFFVGHTLTSYIDRQVRQQLQGASTVVQDLVMQCDTLGASGGQASDPIDDYFQWSFHPIPVATIPFNKVGVKLLTLKRLVAHDSHGQVLYNLVEAPALQFYANHQSYYLPLQPLQEEQQIALNIPPFILERPSDSESLVVIANVIQKVAINTEPTDSSFMVFGRATGFGKGTQVIRIQKSYSEPGNPLTGSKPHIYYKDAYELVFEVNSEDVIHAP